MRGHKLKKKHIFITLLIILSIFCNISKFSAEERGIGFEVRVILPPTQLDNKLGYYYVQTSPGEKQDIFINVTNTSDKDKDFDINVENAISINSGSIGYSKDLSDIDVSLKQPISEILKPESEIVNIKANESKDVKLILETPEESYKGIKVGQIVVQEHEDDSKKGISEIYQQAFGFIASEDGEIFNDGNQLTFGAIVPKGVNAKRSIMLEIINPDPKLVEGLLVDAYITEKGKDKRLKEITINNFTFAPNSKLDFSIPWGISTFIPGDYTYHYSAKNSHDEFKYEKDFTITANEARNLNKESAFSVITPTYIKIVIIIMDILIFLVIMVIIMRNNKWIKQRKKQMTKRKEKKGERKRK